MDSHKITHLTHSITDCMRLRKQARSLCQILHVVRVTKYLLIDLIAVAAESMTSYLLLGYSRPFGQSYAASRHTLHQGWLRLLHQIH